MYQYDSGFGHPALRTNLDAATIVRRGLTGDALVNARQLANKKILDSVAPGRGLHLARELEYIFAEVMQTAYEPLNALRLFPRISVPAGATSFTFRKMDHAGEWRYFRGNPSDVPTASVEKSEQSYPILPIVSSFKLDRFDELNSNFAGTNLRSELETALRRGFEEFVNDKTWEGTELTGVVNFPGLPKMVSAVSFANTTAADDILAELHRIANRPSQDSKQTFAPDTMLMDDRLYDRLRTRKRSATTDQTILQAFLQDNPYIRTVEPIHELRNKGVGGLPAILLYKRGDSKGIGHVIPRMPTMLPMEVRGFEMIFPCYAMHGGVIMQEPLKNLLVTVTI
jgi:hypothetical protein